MTRRNSWRITFGIVLCLSLQACSLLAVDRVERYRDSEGVFAADLLNAIEPHATTRLWLLERFGQPLYATRGPDDADVLTWQFVRQNLSRTALLGLFRYSRTTEEKRYLHTVIHDGVVIRHWRDGDAHVDVNRVFPAVGLPRQAAPVEESMPLPVPQKRHWTEPLDRGITPSTSQDIEDSPEKPVTAAPTGGQTLPDEQEAD